MTEVGMYAAPPTHTTLHRVGVRGLPPYTLVVKSGPRDRTGTGPVLVRSRLVRPTPLNARNLWTEHL